MAIRCYEPADLERLALLDAQCFRDPWSNRNWKGTMETEQYSCFVMEEDGNLTGFILISHILDEGELLKVGVAPAYKRRGYGQALLERAFDCWKEHGVERIFLEVRESNTPARNLYEKHGFETIGIRKNYYSDPVEHAIICQKQMTQ